MKFLVILSALATLATASLFGGKSVNWLDDGTLIIRPDIGKQVMVSKPIGWNSIWAKKLGLQQTTTPNWMGLEGLSWMDRMPTWMCKDSTCWHQMMLTRNPMMMESMVHRTPNMLGLDSRLGMSQIPWWMCKDTTCFNRMHQISPMMMQNMQRMPMTNMWMNSRIMNDRTIPMMHMEDMRLDDMHNVGGFMRMPLQDTRMMDNDLSTRNNFWDLYRMNTLGPQMNTRRIIDDEPIL